MEELQKPFPMEQPLFTWKTRDGDQWQSRFHNVTLQRKIGNFAPHTTFDRAEILLDQGILRLVCLEDAIFGERAYEFAMEYTVGTLLRITVKPKENNNAGD